MSFLWASLLWLLLSVPLLVLFYLWAQRRRRRYAARYASLSLVKDALGKGPGFRRHVPAILFLAAISLVIFALARPEATVTLPSNRGTVILALDISGSMRAIDIKPSRFDAAKAAAKAFIAKQPRNVRIGLVAFSSTATLVQPPTTRREDLEASMDRLRTQRGTAVGSGILVSLDAIFEDDPGYKPPAPNDPLAPGAAQADPNAAPPAAAPGSYTAAAIVLLSDGQSNTGPNPLDAADQASGRGVRVFTIGVGSSRGDTVLAEGRAFRVQLDEDSLKKIAQNTAGAYYRADNEADLLRIYEALGTRLVVGKQKTEVTALFAGFALVLMLVGGALSLLWFQRLP
jgi:Ca-activated chloride channel homolog